MNYITGKTISVVALIILVGGGAVSYLTLSTKHDASTAAEETAQTGAVENSSNGSVGSGTVSESNSSAGTGQPPAPSQTQATSQTPPTPTTQTQTSNPPASKYTMAAVKTHNSSASCWSVINGKVYDLTKWIGKHPGGSEAILSICGADGSAAFDDQHGGERRPANELAGFYLADLQ